MNTIDQLENQREAVVRELLAIRSLRKGNVNEQWFPVMRDGKKTQEMRGPYYLHSYKEADKTVSERLKNAQAVEQARCDADNYRRFKALCNQLEELTRQLGELERHAQAEGEQLKKKPRSPSSKARK
jgi:hypothetical protein